MSPLSSSNATTRTSSEGPSVSALARRIHGWSWQSFPVGMGTGAVHLTLSSLKYHPSWLTTLEIVFYSLNIVIFASNMTMLLLQVTFFPRRTWRLIRHPNEGALVPLMILCLATIFIGTIDYAPISGQFSYILFWIYVALSLSVCFPMLTVWFSQSHDLANFTPTYAFLIFPMMLVGVVSFNVLTMLDPADGRAMGVLLTGYFFQGLGFFMTFFYLCIYVIKIMMRGIYDGHQANAAFIVCGPPGFTTLALIHLSEHARNILAHHPELRLDGDVWYSCNVVAALMLYGLAVFFFFFDILPYWNKLHRQRQGLHEILGYWALTFPNVGWVQATRGLGGVFNFGAFDIIHLIMTIVICVTWAILFFLTVSAFWKGLILVSSPDDVIKDSRFTRVKRETNTAENGGRQGGGNVNRTTAQSKAGLLRGQSSRGQFQQDVSLLEYPGLSDFP